MACGIEPFCLLEQVQIQCLLLSLPEFGNCHSEIFQKGQIINSWPVQSAQQLLCIKFSVDLLCHISFRQCIEVILNDKTLQFM